MANLDEVSMNSPLRGKKKTGWNKGIQVEALCSSFPSSVEDPIGGGSTLQKWLNTSTNLSLSFNSTFSTVRIGFNVYLLETIWSLSTLIRVHSELPQIVDRTMQIVSFPAIEFWFSLAHMSSFLSSGLASSNETEFRPRVHDDVCGCAIVEVPHCRIALKIWENQNSFSFKTFFCALFRRSFWLSSPHMLQLIQTLSAVVEKLPMLGMYQWINGGTVGTTIYG